MECKWIAAYEVRSRPLIHEAEARAELDRLGAAIGAHVAIHGDVWGGAVVVVSAPRERQDALRIVRMAAAEYPALAVECAVRCP